MGRYAILAAVSLALLALLVTAHDEWHEELMDARGALEWLDNVNDKLRAENAELRELARDAMKSACAGCPHTKTWRSCEGCNLYERATKLGLEVES